MKDEQFEKLQAAFNNLARVFNELFVEVEKAVKAVKVYTHVPPPSNRPHDPSLLKDKRKWGGK